MIRAEKAQRIMQLYENDYDNFLDKLRAKRKAKKAAADQADKTVTEAEGRKKGHLKEKAQNLLDKAGGIEGAQSTIKNVMKYFKDDTPSDYSVDIGKGEDLKPEKTIMGLPPIAVYVGGAVIVLAGLYGLSRMMKKPAPVIQQQVPLAQAA